MRGVLCSRTPRLTAAAGSRTSTSGAIGTDGPFPTAEAAEAAAIEWAAEQGAETLYLLRAGL